MYGKGRGVQQDYAEAVRWHRLAAEQGNALAQLVQSRVHVRHSVVAYRRTDAEAVRWYRLAAEQGNARAQNNLGFMYEHRSERRAAGRR